MIQSAVHAFVSVLAVPTPMTHAPWLCFLLVAEGQLAPVVSRVAVHPSLGVIAAATEPSVAVQVRRWRRPWIQAGTEAWIGAGKWRLGTRGARAQDCTGKV